MKTSRIEQTKRDTVYKDSTTIDTIKTRKVSLFKPDSLVLRFYKEIKHLQYFKNAAWKEKEQIVLSFVNEKKQLPTITPLNFKSKDWYRIGTGVTFDTLTYWITDTLVAQMDTIRFAIDYEKTDSLERFIPKRDTIQLYAKKWKREKKYKGPVTVDRYGRRVPKHAHGTANLPERTSAGTVISRAVMDLYDRIMDRDLLARRIYIYACRLEKETEKAAEPAFAEGEQLDMFTDYDARREEEQKHREDLEKEHQMQKAMLAIKEKYGKNAILTGTSLEEGATTRERNRQIGGHKA